MTEYINLTPHDIVFFEDDNVVGKIRASGRVARVEMVDEVTANESITFVGRDEPTRINVVRGTPGYIYVTGDDGEKRPFPKPRFNRRYIVSLIVQQAIKDITPRRSDLLSPDTGPESAVRDETGRIIGVKRFRVV